MDDTQTHVETECFTLILESHQSTPTFYKHIVTMCYYRQDYYVSNAQYLF